jgi:nucleoside-diphosphate-sugar epimerase
MTWLNSPDMNEYIEVFSSRHVVKFLFPMIGTRQMVRILVTGSSGFIGTHLTAHLKHLGHTVGGLDQRVPTASDLLDTFFHVDLLDEPSLAQAMQNFAPQAIVHLAARTDLGGGTKDEYPANSIGVENLIKAIRSTPSIERCIFTSSQLVCKVGYVPKSSEDFCPTTPYGESKVETERAVRNADGGGVSWCLLRPTTIWGPGMNLHYQSFFRHLHNGRYFHTGKIPLLKSYGYVGNSVHQIAKFLEAPSDQIHRNTYYLADYTPLCLQDWINAIQAENRRRRPVTIPLWIAKALAKMGDGIGILGLSRLFPFTTFRLNNILTQYQVDTASTRGICGDIPYSRDDGVILLAQWIRESVL